MSNEKAKFLFLVYSHYKYKKHGENAQFGNNAPLSAFFANSA